MTIETPATCTPTPDLVTIIAKAIVTVDGEDVGTVATFRRTTFGEPVRFVFTRKPNTGLDPHAARLLESIETDTYVGWVETANAALARRDARIEAESRRLDRIRAVRESCYRPEAGEAR